MANRNTVAKKRLGEIFVEQGIITPLTAERIGRKSHDLKRRFGTILEELELVTGAELTAALAHQYDCKIISGMNKLKIPSATLALIPVETAMQHLVFPLKRDGKHLALAMADPTDLAITDLLTDPTLIIHPYIASKEEIRKAICHHYMSKVAMRSLQRTIVMADKDRAVHDFIASSLQPQGYRMISAFDGLEAFRLVIAEGPHIVITDQDMPRFNANALLGALRNIPETSFVPVILLAEKKKDEHAELHAFERGFFDVIFKPLHPTSLQARVKRAFHFYDHQYRGF